MVVRKKFTAQLVLTILILSLAVLQPVAAQSGKQVYAYYFGWWTGDSWNSGLLKDRPAAPYASQDPGAVGRHIDEARSSGIDAFVMSWFGPKNNNLTHHVFNILLDQAGARGFQAGVSLDMGQGDYNENVDVVLDSLRYLIGDRVNHPAYLRYNGKPVIYFWNQSRFPVATWESIRQQVDPNRNTIWVAEGTNTAYLRIFDGLYLFNTAWAGNPAATASQWMSATQRAGGTFYTPTVLPGWDETQVAAQQGRGNPTAPRDRANGTFLTTSWNGAVASGADVILIVSWNEYFENSHIEPSQLYGTQSLDVLRPLIAAWKGGGSAVAAPAAPGAPANTSTVVTPTTTVNVRSGPGTEHAVLGKASPGDAYTLIGETNGWYIIDYDGQPGHIAAQFATVNQGTTTSAAPAAAGSPTGSVVKPTATVNVRSGPGTDQAVLGKIQYGESYPLLGEVEGWYIIQYGGQQGYIATQFATVSPG